MTTKEKITKIIKRAKTKQEMMVKIHKEDPYFFTKYFKNIDRASSYMFGSDDETSSEDTTSSDSKTSSEDTTTTSESDTEYKKKKVFKKKSKYNLFIQTEMQRLKREGVDGKKRLGIAAERWRTSLENPKNHI